MYGVIHYVLLKVKLECSVNLESGIANYRFLDALKILQDADLIAVTVHPQFHIQYINLSLGVVLKIYGEGFD